MVTVYDVKSDKLILEASNELMKLEVMRKPWWANFVKTSVAKERYPVDVNWWYIRAASILRKIYVLDMPIGTNRLRNMYGGRKNRGHKPSKFYKGSGKIIRVILQQLEKAELIKPREEKKHKGKVITGKGKKFLDGIAKNAAK